MFWDIAGFIERRGVQVGFMLVMLVSIWDLMFMGIRGFFEYRIGLIGVLTIWVGLIIVALSKYARNWGKNG